MKVTRQELDECIAETIAKLIKEGLYEGDEESLEDSQEVPAEIQDEENAREQLMTNYIEQIRQIIPNYVPKTEQDEERLEKMKYAVAIADKGYVPLKDFLTIKKGEVFLKNISLPDLDFMLKHKQFGQALSPDSAAMSSIDSNYQDKVKDLDFGWGKQNDKEVNKQNQEVLGIQGAKDAAKAKATASKEIDAENDADEKDLNTGDEYNTDVPDDDENGDE